MQKALLVLFAAAAAVLGFLQVQQGKVNQANSAKIAALEKSLQDKAAALDTVARESKRLADENAAYLEESTHLREKLASATTATTPEATTTPAPAASDKKGLGGMKGMMEKMMKDPAMKKAIASQQMMFMKPLYANLLKSLNLSPADSEKFFTLLNERSMKMLDAGAEALKGGKPDVAGNDQDLQDFLGDKGFAEFKSYEKSLPDRMAVNQLNQQMTTSGTPLQSYQSDGLLQIMQNDPVDPSKMTGLNGPGATSLDNDQIKAYVQATEERNARILNSSKSLLSPDQQKSLAASQKQSLQMIEMGLKMSRDMMGQ